MARNNIELSYKVNSSIVILSLLFCAISNMFIPHLAHAKKYTVEWVASEIARQYNNSDIQKDEMTISSTAQSVGNNVIYNNILRVKRDVSEQQLIEYRSALYQDIVPKVCLQNTDNPAFKKGLFYTFIYVSHYGQQLAEIVVDKDICDVK